MTEIDNPTYYKIITLHIYNCPIFIEISEEERDIYEILSSICFHYKTINSRLLREKFGLNENIGKSLLKIMTNDLNLLIEDDSTEEATYKLCSNILSDLSQNTSLAITNSIRKRITIGDKPLFLTEKYVQFEKDEKFITQNQIFLPLNQIHEIIKQENGKRIFNIPHAYKGIDFNHVIKYLGKNNARLYLEGNSVKIKFKNLIIGTIKDNHPEYSALLTEHSNIKQQSSEIENKIIKEIKKNYPEANISSNFDSNNHMVEIVINSIEIENFGQSYQIYQAYNDNIHEIPIENDWIYEITIKVKISNSSLRYWIKFFDKLLNMMKQKASQILNQSQSSFIENLKKVHKMTSLTDSKEFDKEIFQNYLESLIQNPIDNWFFVVYSKLKEHEVIE